MKQTRDVVFLHGWGANPNRFARIKKILQSDGFRVHAPYLPGFDPQEPLDRAYTIDDYSHWLDAYLNTRGFVEPILVGHSNGGRIAIRYVATHKNSAARLVLISAAGLTQKNSFRKALFALIAKSGKIVLGPLHKSAFGGFLQRLLYRVIGESDYLRATPIMRKTMKNLLSYDAKDDLGAITTRTLIIWGKNDLDTPLWMGVEMAQLIPNAKLTILNVGHNPHVEQPNAVGRFISGFLTT